MNAATSSLSAGESGSVSMRRVSTRRVDVSSCAPVAEMSVADVTAPPLLLTPVDGDSSGINTGEARLRYCC